MVDKSIDERSGGAIGDFKVSRAAMEQSKIGGLEDIADLVGKHWTAIVVVIGLFFVLSTYPNRISTLQEQVESLSSMYENLPEDKALAVGALQSVDDLRQAVTIFVEERTADLVFSPSVFRGGSEVAASVETLRQFAAGFRKLWGGESDVPGIYLVVDALPTILGQGEPVAELRNLRGSDSRVAEGLALYLQGRLVLSESAAAIPSAVRDLRVAADKLPNQSAVRATWIRGELLLGDTALLEGDFSRFASIYGKWWPKWESVLASSHLPASQFLVTMALSESVLFPLHALTIEREEARFTLTHLRGALGLTLSGAIDLALGNLERADTLNLDEPAVRVAAAKFDLVLARILTTATIDRGVRMDAWQRYQDLTQRFQDVPLRMAQQTLSDRALRGLSDAVASAEGSGARLALVDPLIGSSLFSALSEDQRSALGLAIPDSDSESDPESD